MTFCYPKHISPLFYTSRIKTWGGYTINKGKSVNIFLTAFVRLWSIAQTDALVVWVWFITFRLCTESIAQAICFLERVGTWWITHHSGCPFPLLMRMLGRNVMNHAPTAGGKLYSLSLFLLYLAFSVIFSFFFFLFSRVRIIWSLVCVYNIIKVYIL